jgi:hypothetical protein
MKVPRDSKKSAWALQIFSTTWYVVFAVVSYCYLGSTVQSPSFLSLSATWAKVAWGLALPNLLVAGALYNHFAAKLVFVRLFRGSRHLTENTVMGWGVWILLLAIANACGFVLATGVPVCSLYLDLLRCYADLHPSFSRIWAVLLRLLLRPGILTVSPVRSGGTTHIILEMAGGL